MRDNNKIEELIRRESKPNPSGEESCSAKSPLYDKQKSEMSDNIIEKQKIPISSEYNDDKDCARHILELQESNSCVNEIFSEGKDICLNDQAVKLSDFTTPSRETTEQGFFKQVEDIKVNSASEVHPGQDNDFVAIPTEEAGLMSLHGTPEINHNTRMSPKCDEIMQDIIPSNQNNMVSMQNHTSLAMEDPSPFSDTSGIQDRNTINSHHSGLLHNENTSKTLFQCGVFNPNSDLIGRRSPISGLCSLKPSDLSNSQIESKDPLETLANAALSDHANINRKIKEEPTTKEPSWCDVGVFRGNSCHVTSYYAPSTRDPDHDNITSDNLPDYSNVLKINLESGTAYKFRICAVNSCGRGPWSEVSAFRTSLPGYPGAPSSVAISRSVEGAHLSWQPPSNPAGTIIEYTVCLAVKNPTQAHNVHTGQKLTLIKVYTGPHTQTIVSNACLAEAHIDTSSKPAIIFRIAARNEKGFGPPTQVRWLQDVVDPHTTGVKI